MKSWRLAPRKFSVASREMKRTAKTVMNKGIHIINRNTFAFFTPQKTVYTSPQTAVKRRSRVMKNMASVYSPLRRTLMERATYNGCPANTGNSISCIISWEREETSHSCATLRWNYVAFATTIYNKQGIISDSALFTRNITAAHLMTLTSDKLETVLRSSANERFEM